MMKKLISELQAKILKLEKERPLDVLDASLQIRMELIKRNIPIKEADKLLFKKYNEVERVSLDDLNIIL